MKLSFPLLFFSWFFCALFFSPGTGTAQPTTPVPTIIKKLLLTNKSIHQFNVIDLSGLAFNSNKTHPDNNKYLVKTNEGLFLGLEGTGILYKVIFQGDTLAYDRIDLTIFAGTSFNSANFSYKNSIYSFGGYGFWKTTGALRIFNPTSKEWEVVPTTEEKPNSFSRQSAGRIWDSLQLASRSESLDGPTFFGASFWLNVKQGELYTIGQRVSNHTIKNPESFDPSVEVLDLAKGTWRKLGILNRYGWEYYSALPQGLFIKESFKVSYIADYKNNVILYPDAYLEKEISRLNRGTKIDLIFSIDSTIYFGNIRNNIIDSFVVSSQHLLSKKERIYTPVDELIATKKSRKKVIIGSALAALVLFISTLIFFRIRRKKDSETFFQQAKKINPAAQPVFTAVEKSLIQLLREKSLKGDTATVEDLNKILGVSAKAESIKRKVRSEIIQSINLKWGLLKQTNEKIIVTIRSLDDKRNREYYIKNVVDGTIIEINDSK